MPSSIPRISQLVSRCILRQYSRSVTHSHSKARRPLHLFALMVVLLAFSKPLIAQLIQVNSISTVAGNGTGGDSGDGGAATGATLSLPRGALVDRAGDIFIVDEGNNNVRKIAASTGIITTVAGNGTAGFSGDGGAATSAELNVPEAIALDAAGNLYIADTFNNRVRKVNATTGIITTVAGNGSTTSSGDGGLATNAGLSSPVGIALDSSGNIFFTDSGEIGVREINATTGAITTVISYSSVPSPGFQAVDAIAIDGSSNLFIADNHRVLKLIAATRAISVVAGNDTAGSSGDGGPATSAELNDPSSLALDVASNLYISDDSSNNIRKVSAATGIISTVAGNGTVGYSGDGGAAVDAKLSAPRGVALDSAGNLYIADTYNHVVREVSPAAFPVTNVGSIASQNLFLQTTTAASIASFTIPASQGNKKEYTVGKVTGCATDGVTSNSAGTICTVPITFSPAYPGLRQVPLKAVTSAGNVNIGLNGIGVGPLAVISPGTMSTLAGEVNAPNCNTYSGPALLGPLCNPSAGAVDFAGNVYVAAFYSNTVSKIDTSGNITVIAGTGAGGLSGVGGPATSATFDRPADVVVDPAGNVYFIGETAQQVFKINAVTQILTSVAGNGNAGYSGDNGPATQASLNYPEGLALDTQGNLYIEDHDNNLIRRVDTSGIITTVAGNPATTGQDSPVYSGDGGPATQANLALYGGGVYASYDSITVDAAGNLFIGDSGHHVVREVTTNGIIHTVAGNNALGAGFAGDGGAATSAQLNWPMGVAVDPGGDLYIADFYNNRIRKVDAATQTITTVAGDGSQGSADSGLATQVSLNGPQKIVLDGEGNLYVADTKNNLVRKSDVSNPTLTFVTPTAVGSTDTTDGPLGVVISNIGNAPLALPPPAAGTNASVSAGFSLYSGETGACPALSSSSSAGTLGQGSSCGLEVNFTPVSVGSLTGSLVLTDDSLNAASPYATQTITLIGTATPGATPQPVLTPSSMDFGSLTVGTTSAAQTATLQNTGTAPLTISSFGFFGSNASSFSETNNCGSSVAAGASCSIAITCTPGAAGSLTANLGANFPSPIPQQSIALTCTATAAAAPQATLTPATANFGNVTAGTTSSARTFTLTNAGSAALSINSVTLGGANASEFAIASKTCGTSLAASASCTISVSFAPAAVGSAAATLSVSDNAGGSPQTSTVTGTGTAAAAPAATLTPSTLNFGSVQTGTNSNAQTATLTNTGSAPLTIAGITLAGTNSAAFTSTNTCGSTLASGASCTISVTFNPTSAGTDAATLSVSDNAPGSPQISSLTGVATAPPPASDFSIAATPASQSVTSGSSAVYQINLTSINGSFTQPVTFAASGLPTGATVSFTPASVTPGSAGSSSTMTIQTLAQQASAKEDPVRWPLPVGLVSVALLILPFRRRRRLFLSLGCVLLLFGISGALTACGGGFALPLAKSASATYTVTVTGTGGSLQHSTSVQITVR
jgi:trimeric autotransporter adhesin